MHVQTSASIMLALAPLLSLFSAVLAVDGVVYCDPPRPNRPLLSATSCDAALSQMPATVRGIDFTVHPDGSISPANAFTSLRPANPHNLPQSFIARDCEVDVNLQAGTDVFLSTWATLKRSAQSILRDCVLGGDGGPPGRGGIYTHHVLVVRLQVFERFYPRYPRYPTIV